MLVGGVLEHFELDCLASTFSECFRFCTVALDAEGLDVILVVLSAFGEGDDVVGFPFRI